MSILVGEETRVLVQGMSGREGTFQTERCIAFGTNVVAGVTPGPRRHHAHRPTDVRFRRARPLSKRGRMCPSSSCPPRSRRTRCLRRRTAASI